MNLDKKGLYESEDKMVSHPSHYQSKSGLEVIDVIKAFTDGLNGIEATDTGNIIKYACRWKDKNGIQDLEKILWYTQHLINHLKSKENNESGEYVIKDGNDKLINVGACRARLNDSAIKINKLNTKTVLTLDEDVYDELIRSMSYRELCIFCDGILGIKANINGHTYEVSDRHMDGLELTTYCYNLFGGVTRDLINNRITFELSNDDEYINFVTEKLREIFKGEM